MTPILIVGYEIAKCNHCKHMAFCIKLSNDTATFTFIICSRCLLTMAELLDRKESEEL